MLSDAEKRRVYDSYGEEGLKQNGVGGPGAGGHHFHGDPHEMFNMFFGGGGGPGNMRFQFNMGGSGGGGGGFPGVC